MQNTLSIYTNEIQLNFLFPFKKLQQPTQMAFTIYILLMSYQSAGGSNALFRQCSISESEASRPLLDTELTQEEKFNQIFVQAQELIQNEEVEEAIAKLRLLMEKINLMKQSKKQYDRKLQLVCIYNLAAAYQKQWSLDDCIPLLEKFIALAKISLQESLKTSGTLNLHEANTNKHWFKLKTVQIKSMLQYCAVLSQIGQHRKALKTAVQITNQLKALFRKGLEQCSKQIVKREALQSKRSIKKEGKAGIDKIQFSFSVLLSARDMLQQLCNMQTYSEITDNSQIEEQMKQAKSHIYYWKNIPENNIKTLRQSFTTSSNEDPDETKTKNQRNLLGVKRNRDWIEEFTIAKVMFMTPINYLQFIDNDNLIFEFNHRNLIEKIFLLSVTYFSLSIELRFLEEERVNQKTKTKNDKKREGEVQQNILLPRSEIFHLKSIQVVCKNIKQNSAFVNHLVVNYHKHYKTNLNTIVEENSLAEYSELYDIKKNQKNSQTQENQLPKDSSNLFILPTSTVYRKDSVYYESEEVSPSKKAEKEEDPLVSFKKPKKKESGCSQEDKTDKITNLGSSTSFTRGQEIGGRKDKTLKKFGSGKLITLGKFDLQQLDKKDCSQKQISYKQMSSRSIKDKSLSRSKNFLKNSVTLKHIKNSSPAKERRSKHKNIQELKASSGDYKKDFAKKKSPDQYKGLDLLRKSGSMHDFTGKSIKDSSGHIYTSPTTVHSKKKR